MKGSSWFWISSLVLLVCISYYGRTDGRCTPIPFAHVKLAAKVCSAAYNDEELKEGEKIPDTDLIIDRVDKPPFSLKGDVSLVASNKDISILAFHRKKDTKELLVEYNFTTEPQWKVNISGQNVTLNTYAYYSFTEVNLKKLLPTGINPSRKYILTGHSVGGAVASIFALDQKFMFQFGMNSSLITFGEPRVGDQVWASVHDQLILPSKKLLIRAENDPIPNLPKWSTGYRHHGTKVVISSKGLKLCQLRPNPDNPYGCVSHLDSGDIMDHKISSYEKILENIPKWFDPFDSEGATFEEIQCRMMGRRPARRALENGW